MLSANSLAKLEIEFEKSLTQDRLLGYSDVTLVQLETGPRTTTGCKPFVTEFLNHFSKDPLVSAREVRYQDYVSFLGISKLYPVIINKRHAE